MSDLVEKEKSNYFERIKFIKELLYFIHKDPQDVFLFFLNIFL